jgi:hypothetical protein
MIPWLKWPHSLHLYCFMVSLKVMYCYFLSPLLETVVGLDYEVFGSRMNVLFITIALMPSSGTDTASVEQRDK